MRTARGPNEAFAVSLADELVRCGVTHACIAPGSRSGPIAIALERQAGLQTHIHLDERSAAFFALGCARATGIPAVVLCTSGSAAANLYPAIVEARQSFTPMIVLTADRPPELRATGANQTIDQIKMFGDSVVWFAEAGLPDTAEISPGYWRSLVCRAVAESTSWRPGPVHLNLPVREPLLPDETADTYPHPIEGRPGSKPWTEVIHPTPEPHATAVDRLAAELSGTARGVVVAGAVSADLTPLLEMAQAAGWPLLAEPASNLRVPGTISCYDALLRSERFVARHRPDVVVRTGKLSLGRPLARLLEGARQVAIGPPGAFWDEHRSATDLLAGDPALLCKRAGALVERRNDRAWVSDWLRCDDIARRAIDHTLDSTDEVSEPRTARDLAASLPDDARLFVSASMPVRELDSFMVPRTGLTVHANRGANGIDGSVSTALGIAATTQAPTAGLLGDLALLHDANGMLYPGKKHLDITFVVLNNDGGDIFSFLEQAEVPEFERLFGTPHGLDLEAFARLHRMPYARPAGANELIDVLCSDERPRFIEIRTQRDRNLGLHRDIWRAVDEALALEDRA